MTEAFYSASNTHLEVNEIALTVLAWHFHIERNKCAECLKLLVNVELQKITIIQLNFETL